MRIDTLIYLKISEVNLNILHTVLSFKHNYEFIENLFIENI